MVNCMFLLKLTLKIYLISIICIKNIRKFFNSDVIDENDGDDTETSDDEKGNSESTEGDENFAELEIDQAFDSMSETDGKFNFLKLRHCTNN